MTIQLPNVKYPKGGRQLFNRYGIYVTPEETDFAKRGAEWLGWDIIDGHSVPHPNAYDTLLSEMAQTPRKYGFHAAIKPPFHLAKDSSYEELLAEALTLCATLQPFSVEAIEVKTLYGALALAPTEETNSAAKIAATVLQSLDHYRAPLTKAETESRLKLGLTPLEETNLRNWGYPYVLDAYKFHFTLSSKLSRDSILRLSHVAKEHFAADLGKPHHVNSLMLVGEAGDGRFHALHRLPLKNTN